MLIGLQQLLRACDEVLTTWVTALPLITFVWWLLIKWRTRADDYRLAATTAVLDISLVLTTLSVLYVVTVPMSEVPVGMTKLAPGADIEAGVFGHESIWQVIGNLVLMVPIGAIAPLRIRPLYGLGRVALAAAALSLVIELTQYVLASGRVTATDDVLLNTIGAVLGAMITQRWWRWGGLHWTTLSRILRDTRAEGLLGTTSVEQSHVTVDELIERRSQWPSRPPWRRDTPRTFSGGGSAAGGSAAGGASGVAVRERARILGGDGADTQSSAGLRIRQGAGGRHRRDQPR
ncbi:MAG: hypothetical protein GEU98_09630 [Pseudonocardiaceae bacterium]|nr:hypothetical protein [Pseudonocardiaceae bacterium]